VTILRRSVTSFGAQPGTIVPGRRQAAVATIDAMAIVAADVERPESPSNVEAEAGALLSDLRSRGFDLRRPVFVAYLVELDRARDVAYSLWRRAADEDWRASLYADTTGWVVRLGRLVRPRADALVRAARDARQLAAEYDGTVRGLCVEDLAADDPWTRLADRLRRAATSDAEPAAAPVALRRSA
jgi:hypothetical protein